MGQKHRRIRKTFSDFMDVTLVNREAPAGLVEAVDKVVKAARDALGESVKPFGADAWHAARAWASGTAAGVLDEDGIYELDPRTELHAALRGLDYVFQRAGYPSWREIRDEWSDAVENG